MLLSVLIPDVRRSALLDEVAANCVPRGRIVPFADPASLIAAVGKCLAGDAVETLMLGSAIPQSGSPIGWRDVAQRLLESLIASSREPGSEVHDRRASALRSITPADTAARTWLDHMVG